MEANELFQEAKRLFVQEKYRESIDAFTKAADAGYDSTMAYLSRGVAYMKLKETDRAITDFSSVLAREQKNPRAYYYRGMAYAQKKDYEKAAADFTKAIDVQPGDGTLWYARGASYLKMGKMDEAANDMRVASNYLDATVQGYADTVGDRTHLHRVLAVLEGEAREGAFDLNDSEFEAIKAMLEESASPAS
jgi:tetratricopeptide (TPR) repeat protein